LPAIENLRDMMLSSAEKYGSQAAYLYKERLGGPYLKKTFEDFRDDVLRFGTALMDAGFTGCRMAVIGENRYEWIVTYFAVSCGLGIIVPLDKELPPQEIAALIKRAELTGITYSSKVAGKLREALNILKDEGCDIDPIRLISMDEPPEDLGALHMQAMIEKGRKLRAAGTRRYDKLPIDPDEMRILLFTSGTTGLAKGVMLCHRNLCSNVQATAVYVALDRLPGAKVGISILPMHHTYEFSANVLGSLYQGGTLAFCEGLKHIVKNMQEAGTTYMIAVPLIFENMHSKVWKKAEKEGKADKLRTLVKMIRNLSKIGAIDKKLSKRTAKMFKEVHEAFGGKLELMIAGAAPIDPDVIGDFNAMGFRMVQGYGMTECSPIIALNPDYAIKAAAAGLPLPGTELYIDEPDDAGVGEIVCRSDSVMLGYYRDPEETAKVLSPDGWLRTGDYGYVDQNGYVYITGRKKNVIVTKNGKNVFPEEVEYYLMKSPYIKEVVVSGKNDERTGDLTVSAEIFPDMDAAAAAGADSPEKLHELLKDEIEKCNDTMSSYKRVRAFTVRDTEFEKTTTRKIKRW